jgi:hypothetical protein
MTTELTPIAKLCLCWLASRAEPGGTVSELAAATQRIAGAQLSRGEWKSRLEEVVRALVEQGNVTSSGRIRRMATEQGRAAVALAVGLEALPPAIRFGSLRNRLAARALGLAPSAATDSARLRAGILARHLGLRLPDPTLTQVGNALAWKQLGVDDSAPFTRAAVLRRALAQQLPGVQIEEEQKGLAQLAAKAVAARRTAPDELRLAVLSEWLGAGAGLAAGSAPGPAASPAGQPGPAAAELPPAGFAARVLAAAQGATSGRFGDRLVFISEVHRLLQTADPAATPDLAGFKRLLFEANRVGALRLSRADLVEAMDPALVAASEIRLEGVEFHFLRLA